MSILTNPGGTAQASETPSTTPSPEQKPAYRAISDPREVASVVMARMNMVNAKKNELANAINSLADITRQLMRSYAEQLLAIEQLRRRVKELEAPPAAPGHAPSAPAR